MFPSSKVPRIFLTLLAVLLMSPASKADSKSATDNVPAQEAFCPAAARLYELGNDMILPEALANTVALTFDDGPDDLGMTDRVLDALTVAQAPATFFVNTSTHSPVRTSPVAQATLRRIHREGHRLGNHTATHPELADLSSEDVARELDEVEDVVRITLGDQDVNLTLMRAPYGRPFNPDYRMGEKVANFCNVVQAVAPRAVHVYWDLDPNDWDTDDPNEVFARVAALVGPKADGTPGGRGVLLLHSDRPQTAAAMPAILALLKAQKIQVVDLETYVELVHGAPSERLIQP